MNILKRLMLKLKIKKKRLKKIILIKEVKD